MSDTPGAKFARLHEIMRILRAPGGCPWDRDQTLASLRPVVLEETYEVLEKWETLKARERAAAGEESTKRKTTLSGVPKTLPSLLRAYEISARAAAVGFDWARPTDVLDKIDEEVAEVRREVESGATGHLSRAEEEMGDLLFAIANLSRKLGIEPEAALRRANEKFTKRFDAVEQAFAARGESLSEAGLEKMEAEWQRVKGSA
jgi:MazG family protein